MNTDEAKRTLFLYRPGTADSEDPSFADALALCERDPDLKDWFERHCSVRAALRSKLRQCPVPEGLKEQILAERPSQLRSRTRRHSGPVLAGAIAVLLLLVAGVGLFQTVAPRQTPLMALRDRMVGKAFKVYSMDLETAQAARVRSFLARRGAPAEFHLPEGVQSTLLLGCIATEWRGNPVSMICFSSQTNRVNPPPDLWLFVAKNSAASGAPATDHPLFDQSNGVTTAIWSREGDTYILVREGTPAEIRKFL